MKRFWETAPIIRFIYWHTIGRYLSARERMHLSSLSSDEVFTGIYNTNRWGDLESRSGSGSNLKQTETLRKELPLLLKRHNFYSVLDIPCGDFQWMSRIDISEINYQGGDIVPQLVVDNNLRYGKPNVSFQLFNLLCDTLPPADLLIVRDCFVHLSFCDTLKAIRNIINSDIAYLLTTTFTGEKLNKDIVTGEWRMINLTLSPFNFPPPMEIILENCTESSSAKSKSLGLWDVKELRKIFRET